MARRRASSEHLPLMHKILHFLEIHMRRLCIFGKKLGELSELSWSFSNIGTPRATLNPKPSGLALVDLAA